MFHRLNLFNQKGTKDAHIHTSFWTRQHFTFLGGGTSEYSPNFIFPEIVSLDSFGVIMTRADA